jgi:5-methylcytosine-specific restriction protein A
LLTATCLAKTRSAQALAAKFFAEGSADELLAALDLSEPEEASPALASFAGRAAEYRRLCHRADVLWRDRDENRAERTSAVPVRAQAARLAVLLRCGGHCENPQCTGEVRDRTDRGDAIVEVDHIHDLALGGPDDPAQMIALCPNCHAVKTRGSTRHALKETLLAEARRRHDELSDS